MNLLKALDLYKGNLLSHQSINRLLGISLSFRERKGEIPLKALSFRLNIKLYNKLSKKVEDFKDSEDEYIYT